MFQIILNIPYTQALGKEFFINAPQIIKGRIIKGTIKFPQFDEFDGTKECIQMFPRKERIQDVLDVLSLEVRKFYTSKTKIYQDFHPLGVGVIVRSYQYLSWGSLLFFYIHQIKLMQVDKWKTEIQV